MLLFCTIEEFSAEKPPRQKRPKLYIDESLLLEIGMDNDDAFREFYQLTAQTIYAYALSFVKNHHDAQDIMQDTYLKIRSCAHLYQPQGKPLAWILRITKNLCLMKFRKDRHITDDDFFDIENNSVLSYEIDATDRIILKAALDILSEEERNIILLHAITGLKHREIAAALHKPLSTVLSKYNRGIKKLKVYIQGGAAHEGI